MDTRLSYIRVGIYICMKDLTYKRTWKCFIVDRHRNVDVSEGKERYGIYRLGWRGLME